MSNISYTCLSFNNSQTPIGILNRLTLSNFIGNKDDFDYIKYAKTYHSLCKVVVVYKNIDGVKNIIGISISTLGMSVYRTIWHKSLDSKKIENLETRFLGS